MHNSVPQLGHFYPQMGCPDGQMGHYYPQLGSVVYDEPQMGSAMGDLDLSSIGTAVSTAFDNVFGKNLPQELKTQILNSAAGQQVVQQTSQAAYALGQEQAAAAAASYWTQKQQELQSQFGSALAYTKQNYQKILTYIGIGVAGLAVVYFGYPLIRDALKPRRIAATNPRRRHRRYRRR